MTALEDAKKAFGLSAQRTERLTAGNEIVDWQPTEDAELNERRLDAITELNRPLTPEESFAVAAGHPHDYRPKPPGEGKRDPLNARIGEHPESALARQAAAKAEVVTAHA
jgi:hypothetical protein